MDIFATLLKDPVVWYSFGGLAVLFGICAFYVYLFMKNIKENK